MDSSEIDRRLTAVFRGVFDSEAVVLRDDLTAKDVDGWDSLAQINLVVGAEEAFGVRFQTAEIRSLKDVGGFKVLIAEKLRAAGR